MKYRWAVCAGVTAASGVLLCRAFAFSFLIVSSSSADIHPAVESIKYWLTYPGVDGLDNGMRKSVSYSNVNHQIAGATVTYSVMQSSAISRTLKFLSEYYLTYANELSSAEKLATYNDIKMYAKMVLQHRKYAAGWGWNYTNDVDLADANLETNKFYHGAVVTATNYTMFTALGNAFACEGLVAAGKVAALRNDTVNEDKWLDAAVLMGDFLCRLADPYDYYYEKYGVRCMVSAQSNAIEKVGMVYGMVTPTEKLFTEIELQNLYSIVALKDLAEATEIASYNTAAFQIRDQMCIGLANDFYQGYYPKYIDNASDKLEGNAFEDNAWHAPIMSNAPQVGDDHTEYALAALWKFHGLNSTNYTFVYTNSGAKTFDMKAKADRFHDAPAKVNTAFTTNYDSCISFTGYFRQPTNDVWRAWMPYYDIVGFGLLGEMRNAIYHSGYTNAWQKVVQNKADAGREDDLVFVMLNSNLDVYWATSHETSKGTLPSVAIGLSLMKITPHAGDTP